MKDSGIPWIGDIPKEWELNQTSTIFHEHKDKNVGLKNNNLLSLSYGKIIRKNINTNEGLLPQSFETYNVIKSGDIVFRLTDLQNDKRSLRTGLCLEDGIITSAYVTLRANKTISPSFYHYLYHIYDVCKVFYGMGDGVRQGMNWDDVRKIVIFCPSLEEQQRIAEFLDRKCGEIDEAIALQEDFIEELKAYKHSVITEAVTRGLNPNVKLKDSGIDWIGKIPQGWEIYTLKRIIDRPLQYGANESGIPFEDNLPRYVRITDILDNSLKEDIQKLSLTEEQAKDYILENGDILFARSGGTVGKTFIYKASYGRCAYAGYLIKASISSSNNPKFVFYYTQSSSYDEWKRRIFIQSTIQNIGADRYSIMEVPTPPLNEQRQIADYLDKKCNEIDSLIAIKQQKIEELKDYKKSIIYEYVTGKKQTYV